jgi:hypothetical protein
VFSLVLLCERRRENGGDVKRSRERQDCFYFILCERRRENEGEEK